MVVSLPGEISPAAKPGSDVKREIGRILHLDITFEFTASCSLFTRLLELDKIFFQVLLYSHPLTISVPAFIALAEPPL